MTKNYFIDVILRGYPPGEVDSGEEPIITVIRVAIEAPEDLASNQLSVAVGKQVHEIGTHIIDNCEEVAEHIDHFEEAVSKMLDDPEVLPGSRPN